MYPIKNRALILLAMFTIFGGLRAQAGIVPQPIVFAPVPPHVFGDAPFSVISTSSSGLPVSLSVSSGPATVSGGTVTITGAGPVVLQATQAGDATYAAATTVTQSFTVEKATATVTLSNLAQSFDGNAKSVIVATTPDALALNVTYNGSTIVPSAAGAYVIAVTIDNPNYYGAAAGILIIGAGAQSISFGGVPIPSHIFGDVPFTVAPTASSGLPVTLSVVSGPATVLGSTVTITGAGTVVLQASQAGNGNFAATNLTQSFVVAKAIV